MVAGNKVSTLAAAFAVAMVSAGASHAGTINVFGSSGQFLIDSDYAANSVVAVKSQQPVADAGSPGNNQSIGTFGHGREGFTGSGVSTLGNIYNGGTGNTEALYIGDRDSRTAPTNLDGIQRNTFDHSIVKLGFANAIVNKAGADFALMVASGLLTTPHTGFYREAMAVGINDQSFWYEAPSDFKKNASNSNGYYTVLFDLSDLGLAMGASISELFVSNFDVVSTVSGIDGLSGWVDLDGGSGTLIQGGSGYAYNASQPSGRNSFNLNNTGGNTHWDTDPDLLYAGALQSSFNAVPEPGSLALLGLGLAGLAGLRRRKA